MNDLKKLSLEILVYLIGGFAGAVVSLNNERNKSIWKTFFHMISGSLTAGGLTPLIAEFTGFTNTKLLFCTSFIIGYVGYHVLDEVVKWLLTVIRKFKK